MKKRVITKVGDIFSVRVSDERKKYFQLIALDATQLNSDVIRAFKEDFPIEAEPDLEDVVNGEVDFYAHCVTKWGVKFGFWEKVGRSSGVGSLNGIRFRDTNDYGRKEHIKISSDWYVWDIGDPDFTSVRKLKGENRRAEIGLVINPQSIVHRMQTGEYNLPFYPSFE